MRCARGHPHSFGKGVAVGEHQVVALEMEALDRCWKQWQQLSIVAGDAREARERARANSQPLDPLGGRARNVNQRVQIGIGEEAGQAVEELLAAPQSRQPVVNERHPHRVFTVPVRTC